MIPPIGIESMLHELHGGHPRVSSMKYLARGLVWWPNLDKEIEMMVKHCSSCQHSQPSTPLAPMQPWSWLSTPWSHLHIYFTGPITEKMILIVIDARSKWVEAYPMSTTTAVTTT